MLIVKLLIKAIGASLDVVHQFPYNPVVPKFGMLSIFHTWEVQCKVETGSVVFAPSAKNSGTILAFLAIAYVAFFNLFKRFYIYLQGFPSVEIVN